MTALWARSNGTGDGWGNSDGYGWGRGNSDGYGWGDSDGWGDGVGYGSSWGDGNDDANGGGYPEQICEGSIAMGRLLTYEAKLLVSDLLDLAVTQ